jgi:hypothetical protein
MAHQNNYAKSSPCKGSTTYEEKMPGYPTNMGVRSCEFPQGYGKVTDKPFRQGIEPSNAKSVTNILNDPYVIDSRYKTIVCGTSGCNEETYQSTPHDPRLIGVLHSGQYMNLDKPPVTGSVDLANIPFDTSLNEYGQKYQKYSDVDGGQIQYYIDSEIKDPYFRPNFTTPSQTKGYLYVDPMGAVKPQYERELQKCCDPESNSECGDCLSWIHDSTSHREDIMSLQMRKRNEQRYEPRWK